MSKSNRHAAVIGVATATAERDMPMTARDVAHRTMREALRDAGISKDDVDGLAVTPPGLGGLPSFMFANYLADHLGLSTRSLTMTESGGASAAMAVKYAVDELLLDRARFFVIFGLDRRGTERMSTEFDHFMREGVTRMVNLYGPYDGPYGVGAPIPLYAMSSQRYMHEYGVSAEAVAEVPVLLREHASKNPQALYREPITRGEVLASPMLSPPIHLLECSPFCFGAAALVLASPEVCKSAKKDPVWISGIGEAHHPSHFIPQRASVTAFESVIRASQACFDDAGRTRNDVDVAEVYGVFAATELMIYEDLGFFEKGRAADAVRDGRTRLDGQVAMNPSGGRLSLGHPAGATPLYEFAEVVRQLRGEAGERQVEDANVGLVQAEHGMLNGAVIMLLES
jgi:acetyl-CoA acetyltransferase